ncbi:hypothetical protein Hanom_Chr09g00856771 [Helianthus anomalus]
MAKFLTTSVDVNKVWRRKGYDISVEGSPDRRKSMKTVRFGDGHSRFSKIKKLFNMGSDEHASSRAKKDQRSTKIADSNGEFQSRLLREIHKNTSQSHELGFM